MKRILKIYLLLIVLLMSIGISTAKTSTASGKEIRVIQSARRVNTYDFIELTVQPVQPVTGNPFTDVVLDGEFSRKGTTQPTKVEGFCDSQDGSSYKIRFMPAVAGDYQYKVNLRIDDKVYSESGSFKARNQGNRGLLKTDPEHPFHFIWEGTGEHYFWNGTTTYYLMGWQSDAEIRSIIDRLSSLKINRIRVLVYGRNEDRPWDQPVKTTPEFKLYLNPWVAERPDNVKDPGFDLKRFNVSYWQRYERMLAYAREKNMIVSVIPFIAGQVLETPFDARSEDEQLYYRYTVARLSAFSNVTWDLGNEHDLHRDAPGWANWLGPLVNQWDPYHHLNAAHNRIYNTPGNPWNHMQLIQHWDEPGMRSFLLEKRKEQLASGRSIPLVIEEFGYEDLWEKTPGERNADSRRRVAWQVCMAGACPTTGETANRGTGFPPDTGGGWVNGRGDTTMTMLSECAHMLDFFGKFDWWKAAPDELSAGTEVSCLSIPGQVYAVYMSAPRKADIKLEGMGIYRASWFNPRTGEWIKLPEAGGLEWESPLPPGDGDWALLLIKKR